jgi:DNA replication and repair protein RecF
LLKNNLAKKLEENGFKEINAGKVLYGSHRDDYGFLLNGQSVRYASSRGQQRLFSFILHFAIFEFLQIETKQNLILLLDDIFSELDAIHRANTLKYLISSSKKAKIKQIFITSADEKDLGKTLKNKVHILDIF